MSLGPSLQSTSAITNAQSTATRKMDPLIEQMGSININSSSPHRARRFSDADRPPRPPTINYSKANVAPNADQPPNPSSAPSLQQLEQHSCSSTSCAVTQVFSTPELLELILSFLDSKEILVLRRISRDWDSTVHESPQLRLHLFAYPQWSRPGGQFSLLPLSLPGLTIQRGPELHLGQWIEVSLTPEAARRIVPHPKQRVRARSIFSGLRGGLGPRRRQNTDTDAWPEANPEPAINSTLQYEDLLVSQPPIISMQATMTSSNPIKSDRAGIARDPDAVSVEDGSSNDTRPSRPCAKLSGENGISLGFLAQTAQELITPRRNRPGPSSAAGANDEPAAIVFKGIVSFCEPEKIPKRRGNGRSVTMLS